MPSSTPETTSQPRLGAFIVMTICLLLFFGMISRIQDFTGKNSLLSVNRQTKATEDRTALERKRAEVIAIIGGESTASGNTPTRIEHIPLYRDSHTPDSHTAPAPGDGETQTAPEMQDGVYPDFPEDNPRPRTRQTYRIQSGDTLMRIAVKLLGDESRIADLRTANPGLLENGRFRVGAIIKLPPRRALSAQQTP